MTPSANAFSRAPQEQVEQERWLRIAESTRSLRWEGEREAAVGRWRDEVTAGEATTSPNCVWRCGRCFSWIQTMRSRRS